MINLSEPRKILIIITDGEPDCAVKAQTAINEAVDLGMEVVCLGIEEIVYPDIFPSFEVVINIKDLPEKTFSLLEQLLLN